MPGFGYDNLRGFGLRSWVTSGNDNTSSTRVWIVTLEKIDGSTWDLFATTSKNDAERLRQKLAVEVPLPGAPSGRTEAGPAI